jgi:hypothetical protein
MSVRSLLMYFIVSKANSEKAPQPILQIHRRSYDITADQFSLTTQDFRLRYAMSRGSMGDA